MFYTVLNYIFVHSWLHIVLLVLSILGILSWIWQIYILRRCEPPVGWYRVVIGICASWVIFLCLFIPDKMPNPDRAALRAFCCLVILAVFILVEKIIVVARDTAWRRKEEAKMAVFREQLLLRKIPETYPWVPYWYGWQRIAEISSPCRVAYDWVRELKPLLDGKKCMELSCRLGMLSKAMQDVGIDIIATEKKDYSAQSNPNWCEVEQLNAIAAVRKYGKSMDMIVCACPEQGDPDLYHALKEMKDINPHAKLLFIGDFQKYIWEFENLKLNQEDKIEIYPWSEAFASTLGIEKNEYIDRANRSYDACTGKIHLLNIGRFLETEEKAGGL